MCLNPDHEIYSKDWPDCKMEYAKLTEKEVTGKKKAGAAYLIENSIIGTIKYGENEFKLRCGLKNAKLIEINSSLRDDCSPLFKRPEEIDKV